MRTFYLLSVYLHLLAVVFWLGGMLFLVVVAMPVLRKGDPATMAWFLRQAARRLRALGWCSLALLGLTGLFQLWVRNWLQSPLPWLVWAKLTLFGVILVLSAYHDFVLGPATARAMESDPRGTQTARLRRRASWMGRLTALLALIMVGLGVMLVRGLP